MLIEKEKNTIPIGYNCAWGFEVAMRLKRLWDWEVVGIEIGRGIEHCFYK